jgi:hypothetical protein
MLKKLYLCFITVLILFAGTGNIFAQSTYVKERSWWLGLNGGIAWQHGDVRAKAGYGLGFTLEHSFINNDKSFLGTSLRGRYLFSSTSGQDYKKSYGIANNTALNGVDNNQTNYLSSTGYVYQNYKSSIHDLDLELLINTNRLKARKGINLYAFGGIGYVGYKTSIDQLDLSGNQYDYTTVSDFTKNITLLDLNSLKDHDYETPAEGGTQRKFVLAPSFGGGISFRVVPNFYIGFEHKVTFPKTDLLDGQRWNNNNTLSGKNDVYHYSNMYFNIGLFGGSYVQPVQNPVEPGPVIHLIYPSGEITEALDCKASVSASIKNVYNRKSIEVRLNGVLVEDFDFNISSGVVSFSRKLSGNSVVVITASNGGGTVSKTIRINCTPYNNNQELPAPVINMIFPQQDSYTTTKCYVEIKAQIGNITDKQNIKIESDGQVLDNRNFNYNQNTGILTFFITSNLNSVVVINASNAAGSVSKTINIKCTPPVVLPPPEISIVTPFTNPYLSASCQETIVAKVRNVTDKSQIRVVVNNADLDPSEFNYDPGVQEISLSRAFTGDLFVQFFIFTPGGRASDRVALRCQPRVIIPPSPIINISSPSVDPYSSSTCEEVITAYVKNVSSKDNIQVLIDGYPVSPDYITFNRQSNQVIIKVSVGATTQVVINASNAGGTASDAITLICNKQTQRTDTPLPTVQITQPSLSPYVSVNCEEDIVAFLTNVHSKDFIVITVDGSIVSSGQYTFDQNSGKLILHRAIGQSNSIVITASNETGSASDNVIITCVPPKVIPSLPTVQITNPSVTPYRSVTCEEDIIALVKNVKAKENIVVSIDGLPISNTQYSYDAASGKLILHSKIKDTRNIVIMATNEAGSASDNVVITCTPSKVLPPLPTVQITTPSTEPYISVSCEEDVVAVVKNVSGKENIQIVVGAIKLTDYQYSYEAATGKVFFHVSINVSTQVVINALNEAGSANDVATITCIPPKVLPTLPTVQITNPSASPYTSISCEEDIVAIVKNVKAKENITVTIDGLPISDALYSYEAVTGKLIFHTKIKDTRTIVVTATNDAGTATDHVAMTCQPPKILVPPPTVQITNPIGDPFVSLSCEEDVVAIVKNVNSKDNIQLVVNSIPWTSDKFTFDAATGIVKFHVSVKASNAIVITATNESGSASDKTTISCQPPKVITPVPTVQITGPATDPFVSVTCEEDIVAIVKNVKSKEDIQVVVNKIIWTSNLFAYDSGTGQLTFHVSVKTANSIVITATNESGSASDKVTISCQTPKVVVPVPTVQITGPATDPFVSLSCEEDVVAIIKNVSSKDNIQIMVNELPLTADQFTFETATGMLKFHMSVKTSNTIVITVTNESGSATDKVTINCQPPKVVVPLPTVQITNPTADPFVSATCEEDVVAIVKNVTGKTNLRVSINNVELSYDKYTFEVTTGKINFHIKIDKTAVILITATNETGTVTDKTTLNCTPKTGGLVDIPSFPEGNDCPSSSPSKYIDCETCHSSDDNGVSSLSVDANKKVCIKGTFTGQINMNGGTLVVCGNARPSSLNFNSGTIVINGEATFSSLNLNTSKCTVRNFGTLSLQGTTFNGGMENYGTMTIGNDCNVNAAGVFKNTGTLTVKGSLNNNNIVCNSGTINVNQTLHNNGNASFVNSCKVITGSEFHNNGYFENNAYVSTAGTTFINGGSNFKMADGCRLVTTNLDWNGTISGTGSACASVSVSGKTMVNGGASLSGNVSLCDQNGIEQNNSGGQIVSTCNCNISASDCVQGVEATNTNGTDKIPDQKAKDDADKAQREKDAADQRQRDQEEADRQQKAKDDADRIQREKDAADQRQRDQDEADRQQKAKDDADKAQREKDAADQRQRDQEEADRQQKAKDDADRIQREKDAADQRQHDQEEAGRQQKAKDDADKAQREKDAADQRQRDQEEADRQQKVKDDADKAQREKDAADQRQRDQEETDRQQKAKDDADRVQKEKDAADQRQRDQEEADRQQKAKDDADKAQKAKDAAAQRQRDQEEADRQQKAKDAADKAQKEKDAADQRQRDQDEADRQQKAKDEADKQQKANDGIDNQQPSKDESDKPQKEEDEDNKDK